MGTPKSRADSVPTNFRLLSRTRCGISRSRVSELLGDSFQVRLYRISLLRVRNSEIWALIFFWANKSERFWYYTRCGIPCSRVFELVGISFVPDKLVLSLFWSEVWIPGASGASLPPYPWRFGPECLYVSVVAPGAASLGAGSSSCWLTFQVRLS